MKPDMIRVLEVVVILAFGIFTVYVNAQKVPAIETRVNQHEVRLSVSEANYVNILKSLERIERRLK